MSYRSRKSKYVKKKFKFKGLLRATLVLALVGLILLSYRTASFVSVLQGKDGYFHSNITDRENYLIAYEAEQLETVFIMSVDKDGVVYFIDIPNNTRVDKENQKIMLKELYATDGIEGLLGSIDYIFDNNLSINNYLVIKEEGLTNIVDKIKGLEMDFEEHYDFGATVFFPGEQTLDSERAQLYFTYIDDEDRISYIDRQVKTLQGAFDQYFKWNRSLTLVSGISSMDNYFTTSMTLREIALFRNILDEISHMDSYTISVPGKEEIVMEKAIWIIDNSKTTSVVNAMEANKPIIIRDEVIVEVLNGNGIPGVAGRYATTIEELGYVNIVTDNADHQNYEITTITYPSRYSHLAEEIGDRLGSNVKYTEDSINKISIIIGKDLD